MSISGKSLYIHIPFCKKKCPYCHFYSIFPRNETLIKSFVDALVLEIKRASITGPILSIYFGGGTPSLIGPGNISYLLENISNISTTCEITLETNPDDVDAEKMRAFKKAGINRISIGVQSFNDDELLTLKRSHSAKKALQAIDTVLEAGLENISIDLMYDLPSQTASSFQKSLEIAIQSPIKHISLYNLTFEKNTFFTKNFKTYAPLIPSQEESAQMLNDAIAAFEKGGFKRYEISAFAKDGCASFHNTGYWNGREFLGIGPSAFSYMKGKRFQNISDINKYIELISKNCSTISFEETLPQNARLKELLAINLRLVEGVDLDLFKKNNGPFSEDINKSVDQLIQEGLLEKKENYLRLTKQGLLFYDEVAIKII